MSTSSSIPYYQKLCYILISTSLICAGIYFGKDIILPILYSILLASILLPFTNFLIKKRFNRSLSILIPLLLSILVSISLIYFLSSQIINFMDDVPELKLRLNQVSRTVQVWFRQTTDITIREQNKYIDETVNDLTENTPELVGSTFDSLLGILTYMILIPIYTFLILYYKNNIKVFLISVFKIDAENKVKEVITESTSVAQHYISGLLIETALVFILNMIGFLIVGIKYAVFLALFAALLNLIPYVGILVANIVCMLITLASTDNVSSALWVGAILAIVQFLDNNFGMPLIVGNKVKINALATIIGVLIGGALCGLSGMFLAIPVLAVIKVVFDKVPSLQPWGILLGDLSNETKRA